MRQITLDAEVLQRGIDDAGPPTPDTPAAVAREAPEELANRHGLNLQKTHDDLGEMVFAVVQGHQGTTFAIERHRDEPGEGTTISLFMRDVIARRLDEVLRELGLSRTELLWEIPEDGIEELEQISEQRSARDRPRPSLLTVLSALVALVLRRDRGRVKP